MRQRWLGPLIVALVVLATPVATAQDGPPADVEADEKTAAEETEATASREQLQGLVEKQQQQIEEQSEQIRQLQGQIEAQNSRLDDQVKLLHDLVTKIDQLSFGEAPTPKSDEDVAVRERLADVRDQEEIGEGKSKAVDVTTEGDFPGSIPIPGTNMALKVGGFVNLTFVDNLTPLLVDDRFVTASIPVGDEIGQGIDQGVVVTAKRTRLNFDSRLNSSVGEFRAFIEGDFEGNDVNDAGTFFRLRHAFGQYGDWVLGQTNSTLMDPYTSPEEIDLEGISGQIFFRQALLRWRTHLGEKKGRQVAFGLENPAPDVTGGQGLAAIPDIVARVGKQGDNRSFNLGLILRNIKAQPDGGGEKQSKAGWGATWGHRIPLDRIRRRDNFQYQLNVGRGLGRYIRDLDFEGGQDAVFDPETGQLETLRVFSGFASFQHWWPFEFKSWQRLRSTFTLSWVNVDNVEFQADASFHRTLRASANILWSPLSSIDFGVEYLWGRRENKDGQFNTSSQFQVSSFFRF